MEQNGVTLLQVGCTTKQVLHRHALQHHGRTGLKRDGLGNLDQQLGGQIAHLGVGAWGLTGIGHAIAHLHMGHACTHFLDHATALHAQSGWVLGQGIYTAALIDVDVVQADGMVANAGLSRTGLAHFDVANGHHTGGARCIHHDYLAHVCSIDFRGIVGKSTTWFLLLVCCLVRADARRICLDNRAIRRALGTGKNPLQDRPATEGVKRSGS